MRLSYKWVIAMVYLRHVKDEFLKTMERTIAEGLRDTTPATDFSRDGNPQSTYGANLRRLHELVEEDRRKGESEQQILSRITGNLEAPYQNYVKAKVDEFKTAGATPKDVIDALLEAYNRAR